MILITAKLTSTPISSAIIARPKGNHKNTWKTPQTLGIIVLYNRILAGYDGSDASRKAVERAAELASILNAELHIITVVPPPSIVLGTLMTPELLDTKPILEAAKKRLDRLSQEIRREYMVDVKVDVIEGDPAETLIEYSEENQCSLIVLGRRGLSGLERLLLGSVTQRVAAKSRVDVLIVHEEARRK